MNAADYDAPNDLLKNKVILVTGAGNGIGAEAARTFAARGATVILADRSIPMLEKVYDEIVASNSPEPAIYPIDFKGATTEHYAELAETVAKEFTALDGLLHNAADLGNLAAIELYDPQIWYNLFQVNTHAPFLLTRALIPLLKKANHASIIFTIDEVALQSRAYWGAYAASKAALHNLMQTLSAEVEGTTNIRTNSIDPGKVRTSLRARAYPGENPQTLPPTSEVMPAYLYLMGDESCSVNGQVIRAQENLAVIG